MLKAALVAAPVLAMPDYRITANRATLTQKINGEKHLISLLLEEAVSVGDEVFGHGAGVSCAVIRAIVKFRGYVERIRFIMCTVYNIHKVGQ